MGACVSKFNGLSGGQSNPPESRDLKTEEEAVKGEVTPADEVTERRSLGYLFKENEREAHEESVSQDAANELEEKKDESIPIPIVDDPVKDGTEKAPITDELPSESREDIKVSNQNVEFEASVKKEEEEVLKNSEGIDIVVKADEKHPGKETEEQEASLPTEKGEREVKLADLETENNAADKPVPELLHTTKIGDESATGMQPEKRVVAVEDQKPATDEGVKQEVQPSDVANVEASENKPESSDTKKEIAQKMQDLDASKVEKLAETSTLQKAETKQQEETISLPLDSEKQETEGDLLENSNIESSQKVPTEHPETVKETIIKEKNNDSKNPESSEIRKEQQIAAVGEASKAEQ